jgi:hypothetical protein
MYWSPEKVELTCGCLILALAGLLPRISQMRAGADGDDGLIYFANSQGNRVKVKISMEALKVYLKSDYHDQRRKEQQLAKCMGRIGSDNLVEALVTSDHLVP